MRHPARHSLRGRFAFAAMALGAFFVRLSSLHAAAFANGADVGWVSQFESMGVKWRSVGGTPQDVLQSLAEQGINSIRLRVFVNPPADAMVGGYPIGFCDQAAVVTMATRARKAGLTRILIDFHYSDSWADPGKQNKPAAWASHSYAQLLDDVYHHTFDVMSALAAAGVYPQWVQIGNEINGGMLWPDGATKNPKQLAELINRGYDAVKTVSPGSAVIVHLANGHDNAAFRSWFDAFVANGGKCDIIGLSYYPFWIGSDYTQTIGALGANLADLVKRYNKDVMICEVGGQEANESNSYDLLVATIAAVKAVPNGRGLGVFYWEPESNASVSGYALGATRRIANNDLQFTKAITAFSTPKPAQVAVGTNEGSNQFVNLSTRGVVETGDGTLITGFAIAGTGTKRILVRGIANTLLQYGLTGILRKPLLTLYDSKGSTLKTATVLDTYVDAQGSPVRSTTYLPPPNGVLVRRDLSDAAKQVGGFDLALPPWAQSALANASLYAQGDTALIADLTPGVYSVALAPDPSTAPDAADAPAPSQVSTANSGLVLLELYDLATASGARFVNLSSRGKIETGARQMIVGFVLGGLGHRRVLLRGIGPTLATFGVSGAVDDSSVTLFDGGSNSIAANDDWAQATWSDEAAATTKTTGAFDLSPTSLDGVVLARLTPALYSATVTSITGRPGIGLAELYEAP